MGGRASSGSVWWRGGEVVMCGGRRLRALSGSGDEAAGWELGRAGGEGIARDAIDEVWCFALGRCPKG